MDCDSKTLELLFRVFDSMWKDVDTSKMPVLEQATLRVRLKQLLFEALETGETDPDRLRQAVLTGMREVTQEEK